MSELIPEVAWVDGQVEEVVHPDFDQMDRDLGFVKNAPDDVRELAAALFAKIMIWVWAPSTRYSATRSATVRLSALTAGLRPDLLGDKHYSEIAKELGVTKQSLSAAALKAQDVFGIKFARSRSSEGRAAMAVAQIGHPNHNHGKVKISQSKLP